MVLYGSQSNQLCIWPADIARNLANYTSGAIWLVGVLKHCTLDQELDFPSRRPSSSYSSLVSTEADNKELDFCGLMLSVFPLKPLT